MDYFRGNPAASTLDAELVPKLHSGFVGAERIQSDIDACAAPAGPREGGLSVTVATEKPNSMACPHGASASCFDGGPNPAAPSSSSPAKVKCPAISPGRLSRLRIPSTTFHGPIDLFGRLVGCELSVPQKRGRGHAGSPYAGRKPPIVARVPAGSRDQRGVRPSAACADHSRRGTHPVACTTPRRRTSACTLCRPPGRIRN